MAPPPRPDPEPSSIPDYPEYNEFIRKLRDYHEKRGTTFDPAPRVGSKHVDLLKLFNTVVERGGYDAVSDEKLAWRKLGTEFNLGTANLPALAFSLKTTFYKYLAAYEISTIHGKEPPAKEILEDQTAKGSGLLTRTMENYRPSNRRETGALGNDNSEASGDDGTPVRDRHGSEEAPGSGGRVTRGLRQAPPQRILFQPDTQPSRHSRHATVTSHPPSSQQQPQYRGASTSYNPSSMENMSHAVATYEPRPQMPLTLRPVITPGNNLAEWTRRQKLIKDYNQNGAVNGRPPAPKVVWPGSNFDGPNIYVRCLCALKSGIPAEQDYALHHLVKISMERGDKYRFESFPGLAEALIEKALEVCSLFYKVDWQIRYFEDGQIPGANTIDGLNGTTDILQKIAALPKLSVDDNVQTAEFSDALLQVNEAALTLRNMIMLEENGRYVSEQHPLRDFLSIALNLPNNDCVVELKHYALDIAEQVTRYWRFNENDPLYLSLLAQLESQDRGAILTALRSICRTSMELEENNLLRGIPTSALQNIIDWTLLSDEEMVHASLDFLYQYTAVVDNVEFMISEVHMEPLINQLTRLLMHNVKVFEQEIPLGLDYVIPAPTQIAPLPQDLYNQIVRLPEPDRSSQWLRCLFEEDADESITQIALWQAYQLQFTQDQNEGGRPLLPAAEFIKNVSATFYEKAVAQVQAGPAQTQKFLIRGIRHRLKPVDLNGDEYSRCLWQIAPGAQHPGGAFHLSPEDMYQHILKDHLGESPRNDGKFENVEAKYSCHWDRCHRFKAVPATNLAEIARHIKVHCPPASSSPMTVEYPGRPAKKQKTSYRIPSKKQSFSYYLGGYDEKRPPRVAGVPLSAVLILKNLARNLPKTEAAENAMKAEGGISLVDQFFKPVEPRLFEIMAHNKTMSKDLTDLLGSIRDS